MGIQTKYRTLFDFTILHHYFLDEGEYPFDETVTGQDKDLIEGRIQTNIEKYRLADFMSVTPTAKTRQRLKNYNAVFHNGTNGFKVGIKEDPDNSLLPFIPFESGDLYFDFVVKITDSYFENYTDIVIDRSKIIFLSNQEQVAYTDDNDPETPEPIPTKVKFQRISDFFGTYTTMDLDLTGDIDPRELIGAFMVIRIHLEGEGLDVDLVDVGTDPIQFMVYGTVEEPELPKFTITYPTRYTRWRYVDFETSEMVFTTDPRPLTKNGYIKATHSNTDYPNPDAKLVKYFDPPDDPPETYPLDYYSEVFIKS